MIGIFTSKNRGFTIVELLIVIVVIAILASISIVAYNGIQQRARDTQRKSDVATITKALELYYLDNGEYPIVSGSTAINSGWSTTADPSWQTLRDQLVPKYISNLPSDPVSTPGASAANGSQPGFNYAYYTSGGGNYCGVGVRQMFIFLYRLEASANTNTLIGDCSTGTLGPYSNSSNYRKANH